MTDPLTSFLQRTLRADVTDARSEALPDTDGVELERLRYSAEGRSASLVMRRLAAADALEAQLLPFLARKTDRVPRVLARGIPPPSANARSWVLVEDLEDAASACAGDPLAIVAARVAIEQAVVRDGPALAALGLRVRSVPDGQARALADWPTVLVHGGLDCATARLTDRGVVIVDWRRAYLGHGLVDIATLALERADGDDLAREYGEALGRSVSREAWLAATVLAGVFAGAPPT